MQRIFNHLCVTMGQEWLRYELIALCILSFGLVFNMQSYNSLLIDVFLNFFPFFLLICGI